MYDMMYQDGSTPTGAQMTEIQGDTYFQSGQAAMVFGAPPKIVNYGEALGAENIGIDADAVRETLEQSTLVPILYSVGHNSEFQTAFNSCFGEVYLTAGLDKDGIKKVIENYCLYTGVKTLAFQAKPLGQTATFIGYKRKKLAGGIVATLGFVFPSVIIITLIAAFMRNFASLKIVSGAFSGIRVCVRVDRRCGFKAL